MSEADRENSVECACVPVEQGRSTVLTSIQPYQPRRQPIDGAVDGEIKAIGRGMLYMCIARLYRAIVS